MKTVPVRLWPLVGQYRQAVGNPVRQSLQTHVAIRAVHIQSLRCPGPLSPSPVPAAIAPTATTADGAHPPTPRPDLGHSIDHPFHSPCEAELFAYNAPVKRNSVSRRNHHRITCQRRGRCAQPWTGLPNAHADQREWVSHTLAHLNQCCNRRMEPAREPCRVMIQPDACNVPPLEMPA